MSNVSTKAEIQTIRRVDSAPAIDPQVKTQLQFKRRCSIMDKDKTSETEDSDERVTAALLDNQLQLQEENEADDDSYSFECMEESKAEIHDVSSYRIVYFIIFYDDNHTKINDLVHVHSTS